MLSPNKSQFVCVHHNLSPSSGKQKLGPTMCVFSELSVVIEGLMRWVLSLNENDGFNLNPSFPQTEGNALKSNNDKRIYFSR